MLVTKDIRVTRRRLLALALIFPILYVASIIASVTQDYRLTMKNAESDARGISAALSEHADRAIGEADRLLLGAIKDIERSQALAPEPDASELHHLLKPYTGMLPQFGAIHAIDANGRIIASGLINPASDTSVRDRDYFQYHSTPGNRGLFISRTIKSATGGESVFTISRSIRHTDGSAKMVISADIVLNYFENFYRSLNIGRGGRLLLVRRDGWVLMESPLREKALDLNIAKSTIFNLLKKSPVGSYRTESSIVDGTSRIIGYADSGSYPFLAVTSFAQQDVLEQWNDRTRYILAMGMVSAILMLTLIAMLRRQFSKLLVIQADLEQKNITLAQSERRYQELVDGIDGIVWEAAFPSLRFTYVSGNAAKITGYPVNEWLGNPYFWEERLDTSPRKIVDFVTFARGHGALALPPIEHHVMLPDGARIWLLNSITVGVDADGKTMLRGIMVDNTERKTTLEEFELAAQVFESSLQSIMIVARDGTILRVNKAFSDLMGYSEEEIIGKHSSVIASDFNQPAFSKAVRSSLRNTGIWQGETHVRARSGSELVLMQSMSLVRDANNAPKMLIVISKDITSQRLSERRLYQMAHFDHLTHLPNRQTFSDRIQHAIKIAGRQKSHLAVMFLDLDQFKTINDSLGHSLGDKVLCVVAERIGSCLRLGDTVARIGGDEFVVLLEEIDANLSNIEQIAEKLCHAVSEPIHINEIELYVGLSIGISLFPQDGSDGETLLRNADTAMYRAKVAGRNCWRFFDESMVRHAVRSLELQTALRHAIDRNELTLYYQPQRSLHTGQISGVEALIRWERPGVGIVLPQEFIPITEESGLIIPIGNWALRTACKQAVDWIKEKNLRLRIGVNIAAKQIHQPGFVEQIGSVLRETGLPPDLLELEVTESSILENISEAVNKLGQIKALGVTLAIDDFGTGYSSLSYLKQLPIDRLKIDQSFVKDTPADPDDCAIVRTIIAMSANLGLSVIAEGVESQAQSDFLGMEGCDEIQGYLLSIPMPAQSLTVLLMNDRHLATYNNGAS